MTRVHILTKGFASPNGRAFLFPLHVHRQRLLDAGTAFKCFTRPTPDVIDCDALVIDSRFYSHRWARDHDAALAEIKRYKVRIGAVLYFDISDSTGWLQSQVLPYVTRYCKAQLLKDRETYLRPYYGNRIWADYYHRENGVEDNDPVRSRPVENKDHLGKLRVSWNSGLADYSLFGPARMALRNYVPIDKLLKFPGNFTPAERPRPLSCASRFGAAYPRATVSYQRSRIRQLLGARVPTNKLSRRAYLAEMRNARVVVSPFGFGEITLKDFEAFLCGALAFKPDMSHLETWPNLFQDGETIITHRWDLGDFEEVLEDACSNRSNAMEIARQGQLAYRHHIATEAGFEEFCLRFRNTIEEALAQ